MGVMPTHDHPQAPEDPEQAPANDDLNGELEDPSKWHLPVPSNRVEYSEYVVPVEYSDYVV